MQNPQDDRASVLIARFIDGLPEWFRIAAGLFIVLTAFLWIILPFVLLAANSHLRCIEDYARELRNHVLSTKNDPKV